MGCGESKQATATGNTLSRKTSRASSKRETTDNNNSKNNIVYDNDNINSGVQQREHENIKEVAGSDSDAKGKSEEEANVQEHNNKASEKLPEKFQGGKEEKLKETDEVNVAVAQEQAPAEENKAENEPKENKASEKSNQAADVEEKTGEIVEEKQLSEKSETGKEEKKAENETWDSLKENDADVAREKEQQQEIKVGNDVSVAGETALTIENKAENALEVNAAATEDTGPPQESKVESEKDNVMVEEENVEKVEDTADTKVSTAEGEKDLKAEGQSESSPSSQNAAKD